MVPLPYVNPRVVIGFQGRGGSYPPLSFPASLFRIRLSNGSSAPFAANISTVCYFGTAST